MKIKTAILTGFSGQDSPYLAQLLLSKGYIVYGLVRRVSHPNNDFIQEMGLEKVKLIEWDLSDSNSIYEIIRNIQPDEFYNLAAMSHVGTSFHQAEYTADVTGLGCLRILEQIKSHSPHTKFYQASTSELYGNTSICPQNENTPFMPRSPYAVAKMFAHNMVKVYRESYNLYACCGILHNHESQRRGVNFVTRKITNYIGKYINGLVDQPLELGYLESQRDWGYAPDYVEGMWLMLQKDRPEDYVLATGESHTVREFCELAFARAGIKIRWTGSDINEKGVDDATGLTLVKINTEFYRPADVPLLCGDYTKAKNELGWAPKTSFEELVYIMVDYDVNLYSRDNKNVLS